jgi:hypothetical protein
LSIVRPQCNSRYTVANKNIPKTRAAAICKKRGSKIVAEQTIPTDIEPLVNPAVASSGAPHLVSALDSSGFVGRSKFSDYPELHGLSSEKFDFWEVLSSNRKRGFKSQKEKPKKRVFEAVHNILNEVLDDGGKFMGIGKETA